MRRPIITPAPLTRVEVRSLSAFELRKPEMTHEAIRATLEPDWEPEECTFAWHIAKAKAAQESIARTYAAKAVR